VKSPYARPLKVNQIKPNRQIKQTSEMLLKNMDRLLKFIDKHCAECPKFAREFKALNL